MVVHVESWREDSFLSLCNYDKDKHMEIILEHMPEFLYRYRSCNSNNIDALEHDKLWLSSVDNLNDPVEFTLNYDQASLNLCEQHAISKVVDLVKYSTLVTCFTENNDNDYFWKGYADRYSGFCMAYKTEDILSFLSNLQEIYFGPVKYGPKMKIKNFEKEVNKFAFTVFEKDQQWSDENEWRILHNTVKSDNSSSWGKVENGKLINFIKPSKINFGKSMDQKCIENLIKICVEKGIEISI